MSKIPVEDVVAMCFVGGLIVVLLGLMFFGYNHYTSAERNPMDGSLILTANPQKSNWQFTHCTSTNKECGRLE